VLAVIAQHRRAAGGGGGGGGAGVGVVPFAVPLAPAAQRSPAQRAAMTRLAAACVRAGGAWLDPEAPPPGAGGAGGAGLAGAAALLNGARLHVLIDAQGWGRGHALRLLAMHPAPIQARFPICLRGPISTPEPPKPFGT